MKFFKYSLIISSLCIINIAHAKRTGATQVPVSQTKPIISTPQIQPQPIPTTRPVYGNTFKQLLDYIRSMKKEDVFTRNELFTDNAMKLLIHISGTDLTSSQKNSLRSALTNLYFTWTGDFDKDINKGYLVYEDSEKRGFKIPTQPQPKPQQQKQPQSKPQPKPQPEQSQKSIENNIGARIDSTLTNDLLFNNFNTEQVYQSIRQSLSWVENDYSSQRVGNTDANFAQETFKRIVLRKLSDLGPGDTKDLAEKIISETSNQLMLEIGMGLNDQFEQRKQSTKQENMPQQESSTVQGLTEEETQIMNRNLNTSNINSIIFSIKQDFFNLSKNETEQQRMNRIVRKIQAELITVMKTVWGIHWILNKQQSVTDYINSKTMESKIVPLVNEQIEAIENIQQPSNQPQKSVSIEEGIKTYIAKLLNNNYESLKQALGVDKDAYKVADLEDILIDLIDNIVQKYPKNLQQAKKIFNDTMLSSFQGKVPNDRIEYARYYINTNMR